VRRSTPARTAIGLSRPGARVAMVAFGRLSPWRSVLPLEGEEKTEGAMSAAGGFALRAPHPGPLPAGGERGGGAQGPSPRRGEREKRLAYAGGRDRPRECVRGAARGATWTTPTEPVTDAQCYVVPTIG
jgi:hypothetical protein